MPIQFRCQKCSQWIEVDEPHAGSKAICPFCQAINDVPKHGSQNREAEPQDPTHEPESTPTQEMTPFTSVPAEQTDPNAPGAPIDNPPQKQNNTEEESPRWEYEEGWFDASREGLPTPPKSSKLGRIGLVLTLIAWTIVIAVQIITPKFISMELLKELQTPSGPEVLMQHPGLIALVLATLLALILDVVGFSLSLAGVFSSQVGRKGPAIAGIIAGGMLLVFACAGMLARGAIGA